MYIAPKYEKLRFELDKVIVVTNIYLINQILIFQKYLLSNEPLLFNKSALCTNVTKIFYPM